MWYLRMASGYPRFALNSGLLFSPDLNDRGRALYASLPPLQAPLKGFCKKFYMTFDRYFWPPRQGKEARIVAPKIGLSSGFL